MSDFYSMLSSVYEEVFPLSPLKISFLKKEMTDEANVLDLACGVGTDCIALAPSCRSIVGVDLDGAMIAQTPKCDGVSFQRLDMMEALRSDHQFDFIYCVGNSLVHLPSIEVMRECFNLVSNKLAPGGKFVFQIINFNRILDQSINSLPTINFLRGSFVREYEIIDKKVNFTGYLTVDGISLESSVMLLAPTKKDMESCLTSFSKVNFFGSFKGEPLMSDSFHLIGVATV